ncbi:hypothetical protein IRP16_004408 [Salmonella enterica]|nr:hypothetical protein [Salmonella enterica]EGM2345294.1 hypothetical protein [Salmonella enterica]EGM2364010.1 hypothetical protein [Salmonella enterica]
MNSFCIKAIVGLALTVSTMAVYGSEQLNDNIFIHGGDNLITPEKAEYVRALKSGSVYQLVADPDNNLLYISWGYRLGANPDAGILAFDLNSLKARGYIKNVRDVYSLALDKTRNQLLAEHTVSRTIRGSTFLKGNSFDIIDLDRGSKRIQTIELDQRKKERLAFNSHYILTDKDGNIFVSSESKPSKGGPEGMQKITKYDYTGRELWQTRAFPGLVAALISKESVIAGVDDIYEINIKNGVISKSLYARGPVDENARYMMMAHGDNVIYATSFLRPKTAPDNSKYNNIYIIEKGKAAKGFSTVRYTNSVGVGSTGLVVNLDKKELYTANFNNNTLSVIDITKKNNLNKYRNIFIKDAWGINSIAYVNAGDKTYVYAGIKGGHGRNIKHTDKNVDDVKIAKITLNSKNQDRFLWCRISVLDIKSNKFDYIDRQCDIK